VAIRIPAVNHPPGFRTISDFRRVFPDMVPGFVPRVFPCCQATVPGGCRYTVQTDRIPRSAGSAA
jgi:hypothetical protein